ncbi:MAG TPA: rod shape-determining protein MreC [Fimbriimonas sp.]|nr:rod shape-determining protein MreC [Fimbriimonas sp.]
MKAQLDAMSIYAERIDQAEQEIENLRKLLDQPPLPGMTRVNAPVIGLHQTEGLLEVGAGTNKGIQPNMAVVNGQGLVGLVQTVTTDECQVALLTTLNINVGGVDASRKPPETGLLSGRGGPVLTMTLFNSKSTVASGDRILTEGVSKHIPAGIDIGRVISVEDDPYTGTRKASVDPAVDVGILREVQILK